MSIRIAMLVSLISLCSISYARQWPDDVDRVAGVFGGSADHYFERGVTFESGTRHISSWNEGVVILIADGTDFDLIPEGQSLVVTEDHDSFRAYYKNFKAKPQFPEKLIQDVIIGKSNENNSWVFEIYDMLRARIVNPIDFLPGRSGLLPIEFSDIVFSNRFIQIPVSSGDELPEGRWGVLFDLSHPEGKPATPAEVSLHWLGNKLVNVRFDGLMERDNRIIMDSSNAGTFETIYSSDGYLKLPDIVLNAGRSRLELRLRDELDRQITHTLDLTFY